MSRKIRKAREREVAFETYCNNLKAFTTLVDKFALEIGNKEGLTIYSIDIKPHFDNSRDYLMANLSILDRQNNTNRSILFTIYENCYFLDNQLRSLEFEKKRTKGWHNIKRSSKYSFENWLHGHPLSEERIVLSKFEFKTIAYEVSDEFYPIGKTTTKKTKEELKKDIVNSDRTILNKNLSSIKRKATNLIKLATEIDDIDINISISEFNENTTSFVEYIIEEMEKDLEAANNESLKYLKSIEAIRTNLKSFLNLKQKGLLTKEEEEKLQNNVDKEIFKWNNI